MLAVWSHRRADQQCWLNAAVSARSAKVDEWEQMVDVNIKGVLYMESRLCYRIFASVNAAISSTSPPLLGIR
jgi:hypothetical protein